MICSHLYYFLSRNRIYAHFIIQRTHTTLGSPNDSKMSYGNEDYSILFSLVIVNAIMADSSVVLRHPLAEVSVDA